MAADAVKWTDVVTAWSTFGQAVFVIGGIIVGLLQVKAMRDAEKARATDDVFALLTSPEVDQAIERISTCVDPRDDWPKIKALLRLPSGDGKRTQCERDITLLVNVFERVHDKFVNNLIDKKRFLKIYDEITLFVCLALTHAHKEFDQPDYGPLMELARYCRVNYEYARGENRYLLDIPVPGLAPKRFRLHKS